jgi:hypothetical protein
MSDDVLINPAIIEQLDVSKMWVQAPSPHKFEGKANNVQRVTIIRY